MVCRLIQQAGRTGFQIFARSAHNAWVGSLKVMQQLRCTRLSHFDRKGIEATLRKSLNLVQNYFWHRIRDITQPANHVALLRALTPHFASFFYQAKNNFLGNTDTDPPALTRLIPYICRIDLSGFTASQDQAEQHIVPFMADSIIAQHAHAPIQDRNHFAGDINKVAVDHEWGKNIMTEGIVVLPKYLSRPAHYAVWPQSLTRTIPVRFPITRTCDVHLPRTCTGRCSPC